MEKANYHKNLAAEQARTGVSADYIITKGCKNVALFRIVLMYENGLGVTKSDEKAFEYL